uniref:Pepsin inhibitor-3-like repeated domain-containing protein n=1 Tax=Parascaris univalens TaxID=6257 RepID=A0A915ABR4_PARUN
MLFINDRYIRDISKDEARRLEVFEKQYHEYMDYFEQAYSQDEYGYYDEMKSSANSKAPTVAPASPPKDPRICMEL